MTKLTTIEKTIATLLKAGTGRDEIVVDLFTNHALSLGQANKAVATYFKANNLVTVRIGFKASYADWLVENQPTKADAEAYVKENGSPNVIKHLGNYMLMWELSNRAFAAGKLAK